MQYYTFHIDGSGAIDDVEENVINGSPSLICKMYDDNQFNSLNDILHSLYGYIINEKALEIFKNSKTPPYILKPAKVLRKEKTLWFFKKYKSYSYYQMSFSDDKMEEYYNWIDFTKSDIVAIDNSEKKFKIHSHENTLELIYENKSNSEINYSFETKKVVFGKNFDTEIDLFKIPFYSWGIYVSERLKNWLEAANVTDIGFADSKDKLGKVWKPHFPTIEFQN